MSQALKWRGLLAGSMLGVAALLAGCCCGHEDRHVEVYREAPVVVEEPVAVERRTVVVDRDPGPAREYPYYRLHRDDELRRQSRGRMDPTVYRGTNVP